MQPIDYQVRQQAMNPYLSAIVSAPAGSGKTYLLTRRIMQLLCCCKQPEHVIAITFTKKAANEMKERLIGCIEAADEDISQSLMSIPNSIIAHYENTQRLQIMTIDAFCSWLLKGLANAQSQ